MDAGRRETNLHAERAPWPGHGAALVAFGADAAADMSATGAPDVPDARVALTALPLAGLAIAIIALLCRRTGRLRTSGRATAERRTGHTEEVTKTIYIATSNLLKWELTPET